MVDRQSDITRLKIFGERHTNTNYLTALITLNLNCALVPGVAPTYLRTLERWTRTESLRDRWFERHKSEVFGWKHAVVEPVDAPADVGFVTLTKNPYSWLLSMHRRPYHSDTPAGSLESFLSRPWPTLARENVDEAVASPIQLWNIKNRSYFDLADDRVLHLTTESTLQDPEAVIADLAGTFSLERRQAVFEDFERSTKKRADRNRDYYRDYYLNERWREELSAEAIEIINAEIDHALMARFGYQLL